LQRLYPRSEEIIKSAMSKFLRKDLAKDDILDALVLTVTASYPSEKLVTFPPNPPHDENSYVWKLPIPTAFPDVKVVDIK